MIDQVLSLPTIEARHAFMEQHVAQLDGLFADALKAEADRVLRSDIQQSLALAELLVYAGDLSHDPLHRALGLRAKANAYAIGLGQYQKALSLYNEAAAIYRSCGRTVDEARAQIGKLWPLASLGQYAEAFQCGEWVAKVLEDHGDWRQLATVTMNIAVIYGRIGEDAAALEKFNRARDLLAQLDAPERFLVEQNRAEVLRNLGRFDESIQASMDAFNGLVHEGQSLEAARAQHNLSITYFVLGRYNEAIALLDEARSAFAADGRTRDVMEAELFAAECLLQLRRFADVLVKCRQARELFAGLGAGFEVAQSHLTEALALTGLHQHSAALDALAAARRILQMEGNAVGVATTDIESARTMIREAQYPTAYTLASQSAAVLRNHGLFVKAAQANLVAAQAAEALGNDEQTYRLAAEVVDAGAREKLAWLEYPAHAQLAALARRQGRLDSAQKEYASAIVALENLRNRVMIEYRPDFLADKVTLYEDAASLCIQRGMDAEALDYAERAKSRALLDLLAHKLDLGLKARSSHDEPLVRELLALRDRRDSLMRRIQGQRAASYGPSTDHAEAESRQLEDQRRLAEWEKQITERWHTLLIRNADYARDAALWQVQAGPINGYLDGDTVLLEYYAAREQWLVFVVTHEGVQARPLAVSPAALQQILRKWFLNLRTVPGSSPGQIAALAVNARELLKQLHQMLIEPVRDLIAAYRRLVMVPHGPLHYLPFNALTDGNAFMLERHELSYLPSASVLPYGIRSEPVQRSLRSLNSAVFGYSSQGRLPAAILEARDIAESLNTHAFLEGEATVERLKQVAAGSDIIHIAAHGEFRADNPLFSGIELADASLTTLDIFSLQLQASLVTLSACQTGRSVVSGGDELLGLMRSFLTAGATSLVLSLWVVDDKTTSRFMSAFYRQLANGDSKASALRAAGLELLPEGHPYYWAPFLLVGGAGRL